MPILTGLYWMIFGIVVAVSLAAAGAGYFFVEGRHKSEALRRLGRLSTSNSAPSRRPSAVLDDAQRKRRAALARIPGMTFLGRRIAGAGLDWDPRVLTGFVSLLAVAGACLGTVWNVFVYPWLSIAGLAAAVGGLPYGYVMRQYKKRMNAFESQFPDALDFFARALRAGHAFSVSLEMLAAESPEPLQTEFRRIHAEHNLGAPLDAALHALIERVPTMDVRFFVAAVLLQRETGGNLGEILDNLSQVIRDRFQLKGRVRAASAHGRMTAIALTIIPVAVLVLLSFVSPGYLNRLTSDRHGRMMLAGSIAGQLLGYITMKKIVNIRV